MIFLMFFLKIKSNVELMEVFMISLFIQDENRTNYGYTSLNIYHTLYFAYYCICVFNVNL